jgi:hypothetical protein
MPQVSHDTVFLAAIWFAVTTTACHTFLAPCPTHHKSIFLPNFATSVASILLVKLSLTATVCWRLDVANFGYRPNRPWTSQLPRHSSVHGMCTARFPAFSSALRRVTSAQCPILHQIACRWLVSGASQCPILHQMRGAFACTFLRALARPNVLLYFIDQIAIG